LKTRDELDREPAPRRSRRRLDAETSDRPVRATDKRPELPKDFALKATPWIDFSVTSFWMDERSSNFLNLGVQVGGYFVERIRLSARLIAPLEEASDSYSDYQDVPFLSGADYENVDSPSLSVLYGVTFGLILSNSKSFLFAPGLVIWRADVSDYGTTGALTLPFEWTTHRGLRVGFELALGHSFGGEVQMACNVRATNASSCGVETSERPGGTAALLQYQMGWALSGL
jgi:hypothetical protein